MKKPKKPALPKKPKKTSPLHVWQRWEAKVKAKLEKYKKDLATWAANENSKKALNQKITDLETSIQNIITEAESGNYKPAKPRKKRARAS